MKVEIMTIYIVWNGYDGEIYGVYSTKEGALSDIQSAVDSEAFDREDFYILERQLRP